MKLPKSIDYVYLSELSQKIRILPPDEATSFLFEGSILILLAGYPEIAYQSFMNLLTGELKISEKSSFAHPLRNILHNLCYFLGISCPTIFSEPEISIADFQQRALEQLQKGEKLINTHNVHIDRLLRRSDDWSEDFLYQMTHPKVNIEDSKERFKVHRFLQDLQGVISMCSLIRERLPETKKFLRIYEDVDNAWKINYKSLRAQEVIACGISTYFQLEDIASTDEYIMKWWYSSEGLIGDLSWVVHLPAFMERISQGVLRDQIKISEGQAQEFLKSINNRTYDPQQIGFIPTVEEWNIFLGKWNEKIFDNIDNGHDEGHLENYKNLYPKVLEEKRCLTVGVTEDQIIQLEKKLQTKLPLSYRNFLLSTNGFVILNEYCELWGTDEIDWFNAEGWDTGEITDEEYFQYGEHQDCISIRGEYISTALQISSNQDGYVYLLNPLIIDNRNEWEAWDFGSKYPGAYRYRSFWDMMQAIYKRSFCAD